MWHMHSLIGSHSYIWWWRRRCQHWKLLESPRHKVLSNCCMLYFHRLGLNSFFFSLLHFGEEPFLSSRRTKIYKSRLGSVFNWIKIVENSHNHGRVTQDTQNERRKWSFGHSEEIGKNELTRWHRKFSLKRSRRKDSSHCMETKCFCCCCCCCETQANRTK